MDKKEEIQSILKDYYPYINEFLGKIIEKRLTSPNYEDSILISRLLKAPHRLATLKKEEQVEDEEDFDYEAEYYDDEDYVYVPEGFKLDSGLYLLNKTLYYGEEYCEGFNCIFQDVNLSKPQEIDNRMTEILAQLKAFEWLSKLGFRNITTIDSLQYRLKVDYVARKPPDYYAVVVTRLYSAKYAEEHRFEYDEPHVIRLLATDITYAINQKYPQLKEFCKKNIGINKGIIFMSSGRDYFGSREYESKLYGLRPTKVLAVLNKEWRKRKEVQKNYKYLHHAVITTGRNVWNAIMYPSLN